MLYDYKGTFTTNDSVEVAVEKIKKLYKGLLSPMTGKLYEDSENCGVRELRFRDGKGLDARYYCHEEYVLTPASNGVSITMTVHVSLEVKLGTSADKIYSRISERLKK